MFHLVKTMKAGLQDGSDAIYNLVADVNTRVDDLDDVMQVSSSHSSVISASAMEAAIVTAFPFNLYPTMAEVVYILATDRTTIELSAIVWKKKTFAIMLGRSVPPGARDIATVGNHVFLVRRDDDVDKVVEEIHQQTCTDSHFLCDVDQWKEDIRYSTCVGCLDVCSEKRIRAGKCLPCPYMQLPPKVLEIKHGPSSGVNEPDRYFKDHKENAVISVTLSLVMTCAVIGVGLSVYACYHKRVACFSRENGNRGVHLPDGQGVLEEGHEDIRVRALESNYPLLPLEVPTGNQQDVTGTGLNACHGQPYVNIRHCWTACGIEETTV